MIDVITILDAEEIKAGESLTSSEINLSSLKKNSTLFLDVLVTGDGTAKGTVLVSDVSGGTFFAPSASSGVAFSGHTKASNTSGRDIYSLASLYISKYIEVKAEETGSSKSITVTIKLVIFSD